MNKTLLVVTTFNQLKYTEICRKSIPSIDNLDVLFIDDKSTDNTVEHLKSHGANVFEKDEGRGLTDSWNLAYRIFKKDYDNLIISNNDVVFNVGLKHWLDGFKLHSFVVPMTGVGKAGCSKRRQEILTYHKNFPNSDNPPDEKAIATLSNNIKYIPITWFHGFCFGFTRDIIEQEFDKQHLFNPKNINVHQEADLYRRLEKNNVKPYVCTGTYVHHFKSKTLPYRGQIDGQDSRQLLQWNRDKVK